MEKIYPTVASDGFASTRNVAAASDSSVVVPRRWMQSPPLLRKAQPSLNANQLTSISAMISYISHRSGQSEFRIERKLSDRFNIPNAKFLSAADFDNAIRYLADILPA